MPRVTRHPARIQTPSESRVATDWSMGEPHSLVSSSPLTLIGRGAVAGVLGTWVMTAFQKLVEMPVTKRPDSYVPAEIAERLLAVKPSTPEARKRLNYAAHSALGAMWGVAYAVAALRGLRGQRAANVVFAAVYPTDVTMTAALGVSDPRAWSAQDWAIDSVEKYIEAQATSVIFDRVLDPGRLAD